MVGEIRDYETAKIAVESTLTGHIVLSTLHTNDAAEQYQGRIWELKVFNAISARWVVMKVNAVFAPCKST